MSAYLKPPSEELKSMEREGVQMKVGENTVERPVYVILCVCDSVAKPKLHVFIPGLVSHLCH